MREILFRGKRTDNGQWVEGWAYPFTNGGYAGKDNRMCIRNGMYAKDIYEVAPETVGQYTGLTDKNGRKIFDGDILNVHDTWDEDFIGVVDFDNASFMIADGFVSHYRWMDYECEVIGNRWDNPELL